jgi:hypothetical protein
MAVQGNARRSAGLAAEHVKRSQVTLNLKLTSSDPNAGFFSKRASQCSQFVARSLQSGSRAPFPVPARHVSRWRCQGVKANRASAPLAAPCAVAPRIAFLRPRRTRDWSETSPQQSPAAVLCRRRPACSPNTAVDCRCRAEPSAPIWFGWSMEQIPRGRSDSRDLPQCQWGSVVTRPRCGDRARVR